MLISYVDAVPTLPAKIIGMTPWSDLRLIDFRIIAATTAGDLADQFRNTQDTHMLIIEHSSDKGTAVRGLVSKTRLLRQLGMARPA
ncbi:MAG: hypothetical protein ABSH33_22975 [Steroidobacteraceae bacterium]|jgi:hypothetical protein